MIQSIVPENETHWHSLRANDITSTEVAALFSASPYLTLFELYYRKAGAEAPAFFRSERMKWGSRLQDSIAAGIAEDEGWEIRKKTEYMRDSELRMGASFDFEIVKEEALLEIKNVDSLVFKNDWINDGEFIEAPTHIELQVQHQLAVSGLKHAYIGTLIGGNRIIVTKRSVNDEAVKAIKEKVAWFWEQVRTKKAPAPDFQKDADFIVSLNQFAEPGKIFDAQGVDRITTLVEAYKKHSDEIKYAELKRDGIKAEILTLVGDAEKILGKGFSISAGVIGPKHVEYDAKGYRNFKINWKKTNPEGAE